MVLIQEAQKLDFTFDLHLISAYFCSDELDLDLQDDEYLTNLLPDDSLRSSLRAAMMPPSSRESNSVQCMQIFILSRTGS